MNATRIARLLLAAIALAIVVIRICWHQSLSQDELEYFRASLWVAEGKVPYRDFWEHHLPLQWLVFAPAAALFGDGPGVASVIAMRWAQLPMWLASFALLFTMMRRAGLSGAQSAIALLLLSASSTFTVTAVHFRLDTPGNLGYLAALAVAVRRPRSPGAWAAFGALASLAVLANMRLAPLVVATAVLMVFLRIDEQRWRWNGVALWMAAGVAAVAAPFLLWLVLTGAVEPFRGAMAFNLVTDRLAAGLVDTFGYRLLEPFRHFDVAAIALWLAGIGGAALALRRIRRPGILQLLAVLAAISLLFVSRLGVHYAYHFQTTFLLLAPLAASLVTQARLQTIAMVVIAVALGVNSYDMGLFRPDLGAQLRYQDEVMRAVHARTRPDEKVFDAVGYAIHRPPAYRYWFLPAGVRLLAERRLIEPYAAREMVAAPPAAIIYGNRLRAWMGLPGNASEYAMRHYIPLYRDLWVPGLSARIEPGRQRFTWIVPRDGVYRLHASAMLAKHPWFRESLDRALFGEEASKYVVPLLELPPADLRRVRITVDGVALTSTVVSLRKGQFVELHGSWDEPVGVLFAPADVTELFLAPGINFLM